jgi:hypothetical protein
VSGDLFSWADTAARTKADGQPATPNLVEQFERYHAKNPHIYTIWCRLSLEAVQRGFRHIGSNLITNQIRWEMGVPTNETDGFKIREAYGAFYTRMFMRDHPHLAGFFRTGQSVADEWIEKLAAAE